MKNREGGRTVIPAGFRAPPGLNGGHERLSSAVTKIAKSGRMTKSLPLRHFSAIQAGISERGSVFPLRERAIPDRTLSHGFFRITYRQ
jgi:hypothetical protein